MSDSAAAEQAESCFRTAIEVARAQEARWWELRATTTLVKLLRDAGHWVITCHRARRARRTGWPSKREGRAGKMRL